MMVSSYYTAVHLSIFLVHFLGVDTTINGANENNYRFISYEDLQLSSDVFNENGVTSYSQILFDVARNQVFLGARNMLYRLSLSKLSLLENTTWMASDEKITQCLAKGQQDENCHNYVKVLLTNGKRLFTCGTNAFSPLCSWREIENVSQIIEWVDGVAKCPYNPHSNITSLMSENGEYYFGGPTDFSASDYLISKTVGQHSTLRTKQYNSMWLNEPQFVGSFETDKFVYFLFREAAVEYINCGKIVYSRIARMCKSDSGGHTMLKDNWTTFIKARLNCSVNGDYPFYFDEIQSATYVLEENIIYATFTTPLNSISGSAICAFNLTSINAAFAGPFKYQEHTGSSWSQHYVQHRDHFDCKSTGRSGFLLETSKYQLMDNAVQATTLSPLHVAQLERYTHITVDVLATKIHSTLHVIFVATSTGLVKKLSVLSRTLETCVVEIWQSVPDSKVPIQNLQYLKETNSVYIGTKYGLMRVSADHCRRHVSYNSCINAMDPYCGWNELEDACTTAPNLNPLEKYWKQSVTSCPVLNAPVDGGWSSWSKWSPCIHNQSYDPDAQDECLCQTRSCNNPAPQNGGRECVGLSVAVANCTVHGEWTPWSSWSACSATCGYAVKTRTRTCTNPAPAHGGRVCVGQDRAEVLCTENPPCPVPTPLPIDGGWGEWGPWTACTCTTPFRTRHRKCNNPTPEAGGLDCQGCGIEYEPCNVYYCPEVKKQGPWTPWLVVNNASSNEHTERRYRFTCRGPVQNPSQLKITSKEEVRICKGGLCLSNGHGEENQKWNSWSSWSDCSVACGGGYQNRTRHCEGEDCQGPSVQTRMCNTHPCRGEWGCWSDWSPCSTTCGWGIRTRYRQCLGDKCEGSSHQEEPCEVAVCNSLLGWDSWTAWSACDANHEQHRKRKCRTSNPSPNLCQGPTVETRMCIRTTEISNDLTAMGLELETASAAPGVIIAYILVGFIIGLVCACAMIFIYLRKKKPSLPSSPHYMSAKQNPYMTVPLQERPLKKQCASTSNNILNNVHNGTLKSIKCYDYETATIKRNSHGLNNGHNKQELHSDDKYYD